ncbi:HD-GYP domain-containing protein [Bdellovibrio svalbardensis]|uniref:HD domain-containing protein n=1 Tax=Bdellovibrio svalbardensis TaxID=2972972 RepID=A0ABT6DH26_9BACT|nr:HD domain-containing phosphohydrolase [Bdellovibrio svalbardensis]MDG0816117.1 HD domain-containing protein [Bdellovibrio svalbardensis]
MSEQSILNIGDDKLKAVSKDFFFNGMLLPVNVYLKIKSNHYLLIGKKGEKSEFAQLHSFKNEKSEVCVMFEDLSTLMSYITQLTGKLIEQKNVPDSVKVKFLAGLTESALADFDGKNFTSQFQLQQTSKFLLSMKDSLQDFDQIMLLLSEIPEEESKHAIFTCLIALSICDEMQSTTKAAREKVALGCLLHDVGYRHLPSDLLKKPKHQWTFEENALFESHPQKAVEMLRDIKDISNDVLLIIMEHHENAQGTGFPKKIRDIKISPLGRIVGLANYFAELLFNHSGSSGKTYTADEAIKYIEDILGQPFNRQAFLALKNIINKNYLQEKSKS